MNLSEKEIYDLTIAGILHDIGKSKVPKYIVDKSTELSQEELNLLKRHIVYGLEILSGNSKFNKKIVTIQLPSFNF